MYNIWELSLGGMKKISTHETEKEAIEMHSAYEDRIGYPSQEIYVIEDTSSGKFYRYGEIIDLN